MVPDLVDIFLPDPMYKLNNGPEALKHNLLTNIPYNIKYEFTIHILIYCKNGNGSLI